jgi:hypothetical protein
MSASYPTKILLAYRSGNCCALPDCNLPLTADSQSSKPINIGEAAHIAGEHDGKGRTQSSARHDPNMTEQQWNDYSNLIYLCCSCHTKIDAMPQGEIDYPTSTLLEIKEHHENQVRQAMVDAFAEVGFVELQEATAWATEIQPSTPARDYSIIRLEDKIQKNSLDASSHATIAMGLAVASEVARFIESVAQTDPDFPERLKAGFLEKYWQLKREGESADELWEFMCRFAQQGFVRQSQRSAGLAVLIHLFEACEVFEK